MKEKDFIEIIKNTIGSKYIGDDCACLRDLGIVVTQDSLVEDVHFSRKFATPYQLGWKSVAVNISDVCASGAVPAYLTIALSLPNDIEGAFVKEFYEGANAAAGEAKIVGGDITGADKIYISVTAIGKTFGRKISSRSSAKVGQKVVVVGNHGSSALGLKMLIESSREENIFIKAHLLPDAKYEFSKNIAENITEDYAMMDTSDGLMDAFGNIAFQSGVMLDIDFSKIPHDKELENFLNWQDYILWGGEDYGIVATSSDDFGGTVVGEVKSGNGVRLKYSDKTIFYTKEDIEKHLFKHFKE